MNYAVWIALAVVFIAVAPAIFRKRDKGGRDSGWSGGSGSAGADGDSDGGNDSGGGGDGGGGD